MRLLHDRWRRRVSLLASGALETAERGPTLRHLESCAGCREEHAALVDLLALVAQDPLRRAEAGVPLPVLLTRVQARLDEEQRAPSRSPLAWFSRVLAPLGAAAALALVWVAVTRGPVAPSASSGPIVSEQIEVPDEMLRRMERTMAREHAARYLNEAQAVLLTVAAHPQDCDRERGRVDVAEEARRSRDLLRRRALLVELDAVEVASARPVLEDVEQVLREVASLESCARSQDLRAIHEEIARRRLLMKMDLMARELQG